MKPLKGKCAICQGGKGIGGLRILQIPPFPCGEANARLYVSDHSIAALQKLLGKHEESSKVVIATSLQHDIEFHKLIRNLSGNSFIHETLSVNLFHQHRVMFLMYSEKQPAIWNEHRDILNAIVDGNAKQANKLMREHIERALENLQSYCSKVDLLEV